jgi:hypothetical protein
MATTEGKANAFIKVVEDAASEARERLGIARDEIKVDIRIDVEFVKCSDWPKEG